MNIKKLNRLNELMQGQVDSGAIVGGSLSVIKDGKRIFSGCYGLADKASGKPVQEDTIFRMYSMTKPITAAALMILYDRGEIDLYDCVSWYLEGFKNQKVLSDDGTLSDVKRDVTIKDLLTMTSGLMYPDRVNPAGNKMADLFDEFYRRAERGEAYSTVEMCNLIGQQPLCAQPGDIWNYGTSADIIAGIVEVVSGKKYSDFLKEEIFYPLGMTDTDFWVPEEKRERFAEVYIRDEKGELAPLEWQHLGLVYKYTKAPEFEIGGAGLVSTMGDYEKFAQMLLGGGKLGDKRILSGRAVRLITSPIITAEQARTYNWDSCIGCGYGGLMRVLEDTQAAGVGEVGEYGWDGWTGNYFCNDPVNDISFIYMIQVAGGNGQRPIRTLKQVVYAALDD